ncbi:hypothetical protein GCM10023189_15820 [Nibrella saemangeumensis]|uniref:TolB-like 6-blade propeller-like n=1 Tax=Nibrella saemangeumensis TaxID=1084526 RepID=A0ABP8MKZ8_9BACT
MRFSWSLILLTVSLLTFTECKTVQTPSQTSTTETDRKASKATSEKRYTATITQEGFIDCFDETADAPAVWCEASAILFDGNDILVASDKDVPGGKASVFYWAYRNDEFTRPGQKPGGYLTSEAFSIGKKYEDFALTPNGQYAFLTTAFDRVKPDSKEWNGYNTILYWNTNNRNDVKVLGATPDDPTSISLRDQISRLLTSPEFPNGAPYFKVEGLAATDDRLYLGIREEGAKYDAFQYKIKLLVAPYRIDQGQVSLTGPFQVAADFDLATAYPSLPKPLAISSLEYDKVHDQFYVLTSYENGEQLGAYLWTVDLENLGANKLRPVIDYRNGSVLKFDHKAEDLTIITPRRLMVIHDDDRVLTKVGTQTRKPNQSAYSIVEFR